jgi:Ca2+-binding EF-hand superfamily protein
MSLNDQQINQAVNAVFANDESKGLDPSEVFNIVKDAFKANNVGKEVTQAQIQNLVKEVDQNGDGKIQKNELFDLFKKIAA